MQGNDQQLLPDEPARLQYRRLANFGGILSDITLTHSQRLGCANMQDSHFSAIKCECFILRVSLSLHIRGVNPIRIVTIVRFGAN